MKGTVHAGRPFSIVVGLRLVPVRQAVAHGGHHDG